MLVKFKDGTERDIEDLTGASIKIGNIVRRIA